ncbi:ABC transporter substrate-binding protein [Nocardioides marmotae]|uniref:ABC transporter substrate-binding protein n=1 Tax=Nocardioides marmotae TaxID=2663857 RepID=UPI0012B60AF8|nr:ABC transporter substrate-binding protein [Nocardioides marmotae]MBC9734824.1 ABC transporter substrate-binding protein [Nocardioides marmotae]MTB85925.1 ABC transporter substrate-binding protein [Nocardioides marmotae]
MPSLRRHRARRRAGSAALGVLAGALTISLAACGSQLDPNQVVGAGGTVVGADGSVATGGEVPGAGAAGGDLGAGGTSTGGSTGGTTGGSAGGAGGGAGAAGGGGGGGATQPGGENAADGGTKAGSCDGFKNQVGITDDTITIGNSSDISGPVPGIFESSQDAVKAYVAYFNASTDICGRKLALKAYDSRTDAAADQQAYSDACENVFAMIGSMSAFDSGGAAAADGCGLPDIRSAAVTGDRASCKSCFGAQSTVANQFQNAVPDYVKKNFPDAAANAAMLYINAGAASENGKIQAAAMGKRGMKFAMVQGIDIAEFNYAPYVQQMKDKGVKYVQMIAQPAQFVRLADAMQQQGFKPDVFMIDPSAYNSEYVESGGSAVDGTTVFLNFVPFAEASSNKEMQTYVSWLNQVRPGAEPTFFGVFSWSAARLFVERAVTLGGKLSRQALVADLGKVSEWTANGMHAPQYPGPRRTGDCWRFLKLEGSTWAPTGGAKYTCAGLTTA